MLAWDPYREYKRSDQGEKKSTIYAQTSKD